MKSPLKWHGGKTYLADWIIDQMPPHLHYVEPYAGGLSVLLRKSPDGVSEVVNDLNLELTNFWRVLQNENSAIELCRRLEMTPMSQVEFERAGTANQMLGVDGAYNFLIRCRQSRQGLMKDFATLSRNRTRRGMNEQASQWWSCVESLRTMELTQRLKRVVILCQPAIQVISQQDGPNTFFYLDPPYLHDTRVTKNDYQCEMSKGDHKELLCFLACAFEGKFLLSGYRSDLYDEYAQRYGWTCVEKEIDVKSSSKSVKDRRVECLWRNY